MKFIFKRWFPRRKPRMSSGHLSQGERDREFRQLKQRPRARR